MRNRVKNYSIFTLGSADEINIKFEVSSKVYHSLTTVSGSNIELNTSSFNKVVEAIRLIADETRSYNLCMTGQKNVFSKAYRYNEAGVYYVRVVTSRTVLIAAADGDEDDIAAIAAMLHTDQFTVEVDWGDDMDDLKNEILGEPDSIACPNGIPACNMGDFGYDILEGDMDYIVSQMSTTSLPAGFGVGKIVRNTGMVNPDNYCIAVAANNPELVYFEGELMFSSGVTWIQMPVNKPYVCVDAIEVTCDDVEGEPFTGTLYIYQEATPETLQDILRAVREYNSRLGNLVMANAAEYADFKAYMQTQIATILTPINNE